MYLLPGLSAHKNLLSAYLFFMSSFFILGYFTDYSKWKKFYLPSFVVVFTIILILLTRAVFVAFLSFVLVSLFSAWYIKFKTKTKIKLEGWKNLVVAIGISFALFITFYASFSKTEYAAQQANPAGYMESTTANERFALWYYSAKMFIKYPIAGVGSGNWKMVLPEQSLKGVYRAQYENLVFLQPHNDYLWILCELGIIGLLLYVIPLILIFNRAIKTLSEVNNAKQLTLLFLISTVAGWATISIFDFPKERTELILFSGTCLGLIYGFSKNETEKILFHIPWNIFRTGITLFLILNIVIGLYRLSGEKHFMALSKYQKLNNLELVITEAKKAKKHFMQMDPFTSPFDLYIARAHAARGRTDLAFESFENALAINPNSYGCLNNFAGTLAKAGQYDKAIPLYLRAQSIYPDLEDGMFNISYTYTQTKQYDLAEEWVQKVKKNTTRKDAYLIKIEELRKR
ncbi:MAG: O-antigen ligase family protein [Bacteroidetes bacterium]|nr:O-antigen ligase family protein [Bacteroidota bacterium]